MDHRISIDKKNNLRKDYLSSAIDLGAMNDEFGRENKAARAKLQNEAQSAKHAARGDHNINVFRSDGLHHDIISIAKSLSASADVVSAERGSSAGGAVGAGPLSALAFGSAKSSTAAPSLRIVHMSDTHNHLMQSGKKMHHCMYTPAGQILVHSGNFSLTGSVEEYAQFNEWLGSVADEYPERIVVLGSKDVKQIGTQWAKAKGLLPNATHVLCHEGCEVSGVKFYGAPWCWAIKSDGQPRPGAPALSARYDEIPMGVDVLVTAGPAQGRLDAIADGREHWGSTQLAGRLRKAEPLVHLHGHIKEARGFLLAFNKSPLTLNSCMSTTDKADGVLYAAPHCILAARVGTDEEAENGSFYHFHMAPLEE